MVFYFAFISHWSDRTWDIVFLHGHLITRRIKYWSKKIQRRFTKMISSVKSLPYQDRLEQLNLWSVEDRRIRADLIEVFKIIHGISSIKFNTFFEYSTYDRSWNWSRNVQDWTCGSTSSVNESLICGTASTMLQYVHRLLAVSRVTDTSQGLIFCKTTTVCVIHEAEPVPLVKPHPVR